ncbi:MAG TPA: gamma carbonic anhydrase family protein [Myxococcaceae bacterium]|nr:gamma carbonic anhydrase family protein [Myxococcaceae bacterium]
MTVRSFRGIAPVVHPSCFIESSAQLIGDVQLGEQSSVWFNSVLRGDVQKIRVGRRSNIQDLCMLHVVRDRWATQIGDEVTVGHHAVLHGCRLGNRILVGMGSILLDGVKVGDHCVIAAGTLLTPGTEIPSGSLVMGSPGRVKRPLNDDERGWIARTAEHYVGYAEEYLREGRGEQSQS